MQKMAGYPRAFFLFLLLVFVVLATSGLLLLPNTLMMRFDWDVPFRLSGEWRLTTAALHCVFAFVIMVMVGSLASIHMRLGWRRRQHYVSGFGQVLLFAVMLGTSVGIYYLGDEILSRWSSGTHVLAGILLIAVSLWHGEIGRRRHSLRVRSRA